MTASLLISDGPWPPVQSVRTSTTRRWRGLRSAVELNPGVKDPPWSFDDRHGTVTQER